MSNNKRKFYVVTTKQIISADSQRDAVAKAQRKRGVEGEVLSTEVRAFRTSATEARAEAARLNTKTASA